jgi:hypothetical protein
MDPDAGGPETGVTKGAVHPGIMREPGLEVQRGMHACAQGVPFLIGEGRARLFIFLLFIPRFAVPSAAGPEDTGCQQECEQGFRTSFPERVIFCQAASDEPKNR